MDERSRDVQVHLQGEACSQGVSVQLFEAKPGDPAVPQGKAFATISAQDAGIPMHRPGAGEPSRVAHVCHQGHHRVSAGISQLFRLHVAFSKAYSSLLRHTASRLPT